MSFAKLRGLMAEKGITQRELASKIGCSENTIGVKIRGLASFNTDEILAICDALEIKDNALKAEIFLSRPSQN